MKSEWKEVRLGDICKTNASSYSNKENWKYINYLDTGNITQNKIDNIVHLNCETDKIPSRAKRKVKEGDIIYSNVRPNQFHYGLMKNIPSNFLVSTGFTTISVNEDLADNKFIYYYIIQESIIQKLQSIAEQSVSAYPSIKPSDLEELTIKIPVKVSEQKAISSILSALDDKIALNQQINNNLEQQAQAIYNQCFPYNVNEELPQGWRVGTVGDIIEIHDSKRIPLSGAKRMNMVKKLYPYYGAASLMDYVDDFIFEGKYLLLGEDGTVVDDFGYPILQYVWGKFWVNNHAHILTGKRGFNVESLYMLFKRTPVKSIVTGAVQPKISQSNLCSVRIVIPPEKLILDYNNQIKLLFALLRTNVEENKKLSSLRDLILPRLMSGKIDVSDIIASDI